MGIGQSASSSIGGLEECLLTKQEFVHLRTGDKFDHIDAFGRFAKAIVLHKSGNDVYITYEHFDDKWNVMANYKKNPFSFAKYGSVSRKPSLSTLRNHKIGDYVSFRPNLSDDCKWRKGRIVQMDNKSGQVKVQYKNARNQWKKRWTHLDNKYEIGPLPTTNSKNTQHRSQNNYPQKVSQNKPWNNCCDHNNNMNNNHNHNRYQTHQQQQQQQAQIERQDQMTVRTQLLLDDTNKQLKLTKNYLDAVNRNNVSKEELSTFNQKVVVGLTCFRMKVDGMRKNAKKEGLDFNDAFKGSAMIIKQFEGNYKRQFGSNKFLMQRLEPCLNYMRAILMGNKNIPSLPYVDNYEFNENVASNVISSVAHSMNHIIPDRIKDIAKNNNKYKTNQSQLKQQYEDEQHVENVKDINYNNLIQDFNGNIAFPKSKQQQNEIIEKQQNQYKFKEPDLQNMDCDEY